MPERKAMVSIMPSINGRKSHDHYKTVEMSTDLPAAAMGEAIGDVMRSIWSSGYDPVVDQVSLEIRFA